MMFPRTVGRARCPTWIPLTWLPSMTLPSSVTCAHSPTIAPQPLVSSTLLCASRVLDSPPAHMHASPALSKMQFVTSPRVLPLTWTEREAQTPSTQPSTIGAASSAMPMPIMVSRMVHRETDGVARERISNPLAFGEVMSKPTNDAFDCFVTATHETITGRSFADSSRGTFSTPVRWSVRSRMEPDGDETLRRGPLGMSAASPVMMTAPRGLPSMSHSAMREIWSVLTRIEAVCLYSPGASTIVVPFGTALTILGRLAPGSTRRVLASNHAVCAITFSAPAPARLTGDELPSVEVLFPIADGSGVVIGVESGLSHFTSCVFLMGSTGPREIICRRSASVGSLARRQATFCSSA
mmetsp:Transcript_2842/g.6519  ORF Transcript_2842/g.6519 Transcript_2842/m.6519 type:complete len:353 (+) Transcript_2842:1167-2225(+)